MASHAQAAFNHQTLLEPIKTISINLKAGGRALPPPSPALKGVLGWSWA